MQYMIHDRDCRSDTTVPDVPSLQKYLARIHKGAARSDQLLIEADKEIHWGAVASVMAACNAAGFDNVNFAKHKSAAPSEKREEHENLPPEKE